MYITRVTEVVASGGFSSKILGFVVMPIKNNLTIYDEVFRYICLKYGHFDQLRVDQKGHSGCPLLHRTAAQLV